MSTAPRIRSISSPRVREGEPMVFDISLTSAAAAGSVIGLSLGGTATAGLDFRSRPEVSFDGGRTFTALSGSNISLPAGTCDLKVRIPTFNDRLIETDDSIVLNARMNGTTVASTGSVVDDDKGLRVVSVVGSEVVEGNRLTYTVNLAGGPTQPCRTPGSNCPPEQWTCSSTNGRGTIDLGDYKIELIEHNSVWILTNKITGAATRIWGDPHVDIGNNGTTEFDFKKDMTFQLADGTKITVETVPWGNSGMTLSSKLTITDWCNQNAMVVTGLGWDSDGVNNLQVQKLDGQGRSLDVNTSDGAFTLYENSEGGWHIFDGRSANQSLINQLEAGTLRDVSAEVTLNLVAGSATLNADYQGRIEVSLDDGRTWSLIDANKLTVPAKLDHFLVRIPTIDDTLVESRETVSLKAEAVCGTASGVGSILDNDAPPAVSVLSVSSAQANEGDPLTFQVALSRATTASTPVALTLTSGTATAGIDFSTGGLQVSFDGGRSFSTLAGSTVNVPAGASGFQLRVASLEDTVFEGNETFSLRASTPAGSASGIGTICEDDSAPKVTAVNSVQANEGDALCFSVTLSNASTSATNVALALANGTATSGADYAVTGLQVSFDGGRSFTTIAGNTVSVPANTASFQVKVASIEDSLVEPNETFTLQASANGGSATGTGTIVNDDVAPPPPPLAVTSVAAAQANEGDALCFTVQLNRASAAPARVDLALSNGTATGGVDYATTGLQVSFDGGRTFGAITGNSVNVPANVTSFQVKVASLEDTVFEGNETFSLRASTPAGSASGIGTICEDDSAPKVLSVGNAQANEGDALCFSVTLSNASTTTTNVSLALSSGTATAGVDFSTAGLQVSFDGGRSFSPVTGPNLTVPAGATSFQVKVASIEDSLVEPNETFTLQASANGGSATGIGTILNDDVAPPPPPPPLDPSNFTIVGAAKVLEGAPRSDFTIRLNQALSQDVTITLKVSDLTAHRVGTEAANQSYVKDQGTFDAWRTVLPDATVGKASLTKDYTVYDSQGNIVTGDTVTVTIRAGQLVSSAFGVQAWQEIQRVSQRGAEIEGDETFRVEITSLNGQAPATRVGNTVTICDNHVGRISPIIIDMDGDGVQTTGIDQSTARFDMDLDGTKDATGWVSRTDALLAHDANRDGVINDRSELFGGQIGEGFAKLDGFDSNRDGVVDANDARFQELKLWQDRDGDGTTDDGELIGLSEAGLASLRTSYTIDPEHQNGNMLIERSSAQFADGRQADMVDAYFQVESGQPPQLRDILSDAAEDAIPLGQSAMQSKDFGSAVAAADHGEPGIDLQHLMHKPIPPAE